MVYSESTNEYWVFNMLHFLPGVCLFVKKREFVLNAYQCYNFEEGCPRLRYWANESYKCK